MPANTPFVGRSSELALLDQVLDAVEGGDARTLEIVGPAGIGKTRLLSELARRAEDRGHLVLGGTGAELEQDLPFWVFVDALDEYVEGLDPRRLGRLDPMVRAELAQVLPALASGSDAPEGTLHERYRTHRAMRELLEQLAATKPLVLILDDVHWADQASLDLLVALLHRPPAAGVLLTIAARPRQLPPRLSAMLERARRDETLALIELVPLTRDEARSMVGADADELYEDSGGNPFFLEQLARAPGQPAAHTGDVELSGVQVPPQVAAALAEELASLSPGARSALDGAAVAGDPFEVDLAAVAGGVGEPEMLAAIDELVAADFVRATDMPRRFRFRHPIVRRAIYEETPGGWRLAAHERAAVELARRGASATARAHHVERSARQGDLDAVAVLAEAGRETASRAPTTAVRLYAAALALLPDTAPAPQRVDLLLPLSQVLAAAGRFDDARAAVLECLDLVPEEERAQRTQLTALCARIEHLLGLHEIAHERLLRALDALPEEACEHCVSLMIELTMDGLHRMNYPAMMEWGERAAETAADLPDDALRAVALAAAARGAAFPGVTADARRRQAEAAELIDGLPDDVVARRLDALAYLAGAELYLFMLDDGHRHAARAIAIGRATGQGQQFPLLHAILGMTAYFQGRSHQVVDALDGAVEAARLSSNAQALTWSLYPRAMAAYQLGDIATAASAAQEAVDVIDDGRPSHHFSHAAFALAEAELELGKPERAVELLERAGGGADMPLAAPSFRELFLEAMVRARLACGDRNGAAHAAELARAAAAKARMPFCRGWADRAAAAIAFEDGDAARAAELALSAAAQQDAAGGAVEAARSLTLAGRALAQAGDRERAREALQEAASVLDARGAVRFRDAAERALRQLGHRIHRRSQATAATGEGIDRLTAREMEVARRIVDRQTNREIAEELFLSPKTVETHIRNIFRKLGADSRVDVARIVERADRMAAAETP